MSDLRGIYLGVDVGATKTSVSVWDAAEDVLDEQVGPGASWEILGVSAARENLQIALAAVFDNLEMPAAQLAGAAFGVAGFDWESDRQIVAELVALPGLRGEPIIVNDAFVALRGGAPANVGCVSAAGTGSVTAARSSTGETARTYALGLGEHAGAIGLGQAAVAAACAAEFGTGEPTALTEALVRSAGADDLGSLLRLIERERTLSVQQLAPAVLGCVGTGDDVAVAIARDAGNRLAQTACALARKLGIDQEEIPLVRSGAVHLAGCAPLDEAFLEVAARELPRAQVRLLSVPPSRGALLLALDAAAIPATSLELVQPQNGSE